MQILETHRLVVEMAVLGRLFGMRLNNIATNPPPAEDDGTFLPIFEVEAFKNL